MNRMINRHIFCVLSLLLLNMAGCGFEISGDGNGSTVSAAAKTTSITLVWRAPESNANGSVLTDLAGYKIYYGISSENYTRLIDVGNFTGMIINNLSPGEWCFAVTAYDITGNESTFSEEICKII